MSNHLRTIYGIQVLTSRHRELKRLKRELPTPNLHGHQIWQSSFGIMEHLLDHPLQQHCRVMDVGCGWGLLGVFCAKHFAADVTLVDADSRVFPYVDCHTQLNAVSAATRTATLGDLVAADFAQQDVVLGADICFWPELATELRKTIEVALAAGVKQVIIADPGRNDFMQMAAYFQTHYFAQLLPWEITGRSRKDGYMLLINNTVLAEPSAA